METAGYRSIRWVSRWACTGLSRPDTDQARDTTNRRTCGEFFPPGRTEITPTAGQGLPNAATRQTRRTDRISNSKRALTRGPFLSSDLSISRQRRSTSAGRSASALTTTIRSRSQNVREQYDHARRLVVGRSRTGSQQKRITAAWSLDGLRWELSHPEVKQDPPVAGFAVASSPETTGSPVSAGSPESVELPQSTGSFELPEATGSAGSPESASSPEATGFPEATGSPKAVGSPEAAESAGSPEPFGSPESAGSPEATGSPEADYSARAPGEQTPDSFSGCCRAVQSRSGRCTQRLCRYRKTGP